MSGSLGVVIQQNLSRCRTATSNLTLAVRPQQHVQVRNLPWVPLAYRKGARSSPANVVRSRPPPKTRGNLRTRTPPAKRSRRGPSLNYRSSDHAPSRRIGHRHASLSFTIQSHKESLLKMQKELDLSILRYRQSLGAVEMSKGDPTATKKPAEGSSHQVTSLLSALSELHKGQSPDSWKKVEDTEEGFRQVGSLVSDMSLLATKIQALVLKEISQKNDKQEEHVLYFYCSLAEQLLLSLIQMQSDRLDFVKTGAAGDTEASGFKLSWFGWLKDKILDKHGKKSPSKKGNERIMMHEDPLCSPRLEHFQSLAEVVLNTLRQELKDPHQSSFRKIRRAQRLQQLIEKTPPNVEPNAKVLRTLMNAYALVGSYESARACEKVAKKHPEIHDDVFGAVLHAYFMAAKSSPRSQERSKAAVRADELVREKWMIHEYEEKKFVHCTKAMLCLNAVGGEAIPDINVRADTLANMCVGRENLEEVFRNGNLEGLWKVAPSSLTLPLLNCLVLIYASSRDASRVNLAKRLLQILLEDSDFKENIGVPFPDVRTCKSVLAGLVGINDRRIRWARVASPGDEQSNTSKHLKDSSPENLEYGMQLLDHMFARSQCWPDQSYFHSLLRLLLMARPPGTGNTADTLLSKMHIRECFGKIGLSGNLTMVTRKTYHYVLRAWLASAEAGDPQTAKRALELVELMEGQSLPLLSSSDSGKSDGPTRYRSSVLPDRSTYQLLLKACSSVRVESEKEEALDIALVVDQKMKRRGIAPTSDTYSLLFACCANLLPESSKRRQHVTSRLLEDAREQGNVNEIVLEKVREFKTDEASNDGRKSKIGARGGGGLLSDL